MSNLQLPAEAIKGSQSGWFCNAWIIEKARREKYMVAFMVSAIVNVVLFWMVIR